MPRFATLYGCLKLQTPQHPKRSERCKVVGLQPLLKVNDAVIQPSTLRWSQSEPIFQVPMVLEDIEVRLNGVRTHRNRYTQEQG